MKTITLEIPDALDAASEEKIKQDLTDYLEELLYEQQSDEPEAERIPVFGCAKGKFRMSADFDAPLDHFDDCMSA